MGDTCRQCQWHSWRLIMSPSIWQKLSISGRNRFGFCILSILGSASVRAFKFVMETSFKPVFPDKWSVACRLIPVLCRSAPGPETLIIGTSLVRGIGTHLSNRGINSTTYCYPGADIPRVGRRLETILTPRNKPAHVVLQLGGNDLEEHPPAEVVQQYGKLIHEVKRRCPRSTSVFVNRVSPRGHNGRIRQGINMVNTYLRSRGKRGDGVRYIDSCPHFPGQLKKDKLHFSKTGSRDYADKLACHLINFQVDTWKKRDWSMITIRPRAPQKYAKHP